MPGERNDQLSSKPLIGTARPALLRTRSYPRGVQGNFGLQVSGFRSSSPTLFDDEEIRAVYLSASECTELIEGPPSLQSMKICCGYLNDPYETSTRRALIPQFQLHGSGFAVCEMLKVDNGICAVLADLVFKNIDDPSSMRQRLEDAGLPARCEGMNTHASRRHLSQLILRHGSVAIEIGGELEQHFVIVDRIDELAHIAQIRDPYHGWAIAVDLDAFERRVRDVGSHTAVVYVDKSQSGLRRLMLDRMIDAAVSPYPLLQFALRRSRTARLLARLLIARLAARN